MNHTSNKSFMNQLLLRMSILIILPILLSILLFQNIKNIIILNYSEAAQQSVVIAANNIDYLLENISDVTNSILSNHEMLSYLQDNKRNFFLENLNNYYISNFYIEGIYTRSTMGFGYVGANLVNIQNMDEWMELKETTGEIKWFPTRKQQVQILTGRQEKNMIMVGRKIVDISSLKELGYLKIAVDERTLAEFYEKLTTDGSKVFICDQNGNVISSSDEDFNTLMLNQHTYLEHIIENAGSGYEEYEEDGEKYVAIFSGLNNGSWRIVKEVPKDVLYYEINRIQSIVFMTISFFVLGMFIISFIFSRKITDPLKKLILQMKQVEEGNMDVTVEIETNKELKELGSSFNEMVDKVKRLMNDIVITERNKKDIELEVLHAQINPHFLYNTLNTIRWMAKLKGEDGISNAIVALVKLLRISISVDKNMIMINEEIKYVESYLLIQKLRFNQMFEVKYDIDEEIQRYYIPKLILQPIVENSLIYSLDESEDLDHDVLHINIYSEIKYDHVELVVEDDGVGMDEDRLTSVLQTDKGIDKFSKVGLNNVNQRIKMYYGDKWNIRIISEKGKGTKVIIPIPIQIQEADSVQSNDC